MKKSERVKVQKEIKILRNCGHMLAIITNEMARVGAWRTFRALAKTHDLFQIEACDILKNGCLAQPKKKKKVKKK